MEDYLKSLLPLLGDEDGFLKLLIEMDKKYRGKLITSVGNRFNNHYLNIFYKTSYRIEKWSEKYIEQLEQFAIYHYSSYNYKINEVLTRHGTKPTHEMKVSMLKYFPLRVINNDLSDQHINLYCHHLPIIMEMKPEDIQKYAIESGFRMRCKQVDLSKLHIPRFPFDTVETIHELATGKYSILLDLPDFLLDENILLRLLNLHPNPFKVDISIPIKPSIFYDRDYLLTICDHKIGQLMLEHQHYPIEHYIDPKFHGVLELNEAAMIFNKPAKSIPWEIMDKIAQSGIIVDSINKIQLVHAYLRCDLKIPEILMSEEIKRMLKYGADELPKKYKVHPDPPKPTSESIYKWLVEMINMTPARAQRFRLFPEELINQEIAELYYKLDPIRVWPVIQNYLTLEMVKPYVDSDIRYICKIENIDILRELSNEMDISSFICRRVRNRMCRKKSAYSDISV